MEKNREKDCDLDQISRHLNINSSQIPILHPEIFEVENFYAGGARSINDQPSGDRQVDIDELLSVNNTNRFQCLFGPPGVGKTTLSKRLAKNQTYKLSFHLSFSEMDYSNQLTLQELLLDNKFDNFEFTSEKCKKVFSWILLNQSKCLLVLDGLDQALFINNLNKQPPSVKHDERLTISVIIACLFKKTFLPNARIIVTSRAHALSHLHHTLRPDNVYQLQGLSQDDTATLLRCFAGDQFEDMYCKLTQLSPKLKDLCRCPLILQMFFLSQKKPSMHIGEATTLTRIFTVVLKTLVHSKHNRGEFENIQDKLASLAYNTLIKNQIMITWEEAKKENLEENEIHDLIVVIPGYQELSFHVLESENMLFFSHQLFHEYYCALHTYNMTDDDFRGFLEQTKQDDNFDEVKKFLFGLVCDVNKDGGKMIS